MTKEGIRLGESTAIILYSVLLDQIWFAIAIPILLVAGIYMDVVPTSVGFLGEASILILYISLLSYAGVLAYGVLIKPSVISKIIKWFAKLSFVRKYREKIHFEAANLEQYAHQLKAKPFRFLLQAFIYSTMSWLARVALAPIVILSLLPAPELLSVLRSLAMNLAFLVVPTPGGSGGVEGLFVLFQGPLISREAFIGLALFLWRIISYYITIAMGMMATTWYVNQEVYEYKSS